jgi:hypothetical protein
MSDPLKLGSDMFNIIINIINIIIFIINNIIINIFLKKYYYCCNPFLGPHKK